MVSVWFIQFDKLNILEKSIWSSVKTKENEYLSLRFLLINFSTVFNGKIMAVNVLYIKNHLYCISDHIHTKQYRVIERVLEIHCEFQEAESCSALLQMVCFCLERILLFLVAKPGKNRNYMQALCVNFIYKFHT